MRNRLEEQIHDLAVALARLRGMIGSGSVGAPIGAEYLTGASHGGLTDERVVTNTATVSWDLATSGQAKAVARVDHAGLMTFTGGPLIYTMNRAYIQGSLLVTIGVVLLRPGVDFTTAGTTFTLDGAWSATIAAGGEAAVLTPRQGWY